jgi:hypothetical protein
MNAVVMRLRTTFQEARQIYREKGFRAVLARFGWKFVVAIFLYYLIRDLTLYVLIPWLLISKT